jgi:hypothetical protein
MFLVTGWLKLITHPLLCFITCKFGAPVQLVMHALTVYQVLSPKILLQRIKLHNQSQLTYQDSFKNAIVGLNLLHDSCCFPFSYRHTNLSTPYLLFLSFEFKASSQLEVIIGQKNNAPIKLTTIHELKLFVFAELSESSSLCCP